MSLYQAKPVVDPLERQRVENERRRERNIERAKRILHPKTRVMGVDTATLSRQVSERQESERLEAERNIYFDELTVRHAKIASEQHSNRDLDRKREAQELEFFRAQQIKEKKARALSEQAARTAPELDTRFLNFDGQDTDFQNRKKMQQMQMRDWLAQQSENLRQKENRAAQDQADYDALEAKMNEAKGQLEDAQSRSRTQELRQTVLTNKQLAAEKKLREQQEKDRNQRQNDLEVANTLSSAFMTEDVGQRVMGGSRGCTTALQYHYKGMTTDQRQHILDVQAHQIAELQARRDAEREDAQRYHDEQETIRRDLLKRERARDLQKQEERLALGVTRSAQKHDAALRSNVLNNVTYQNPVSEEFFGQFGTSCR